MLTYFKDLFTARNGVDYSLTKAVGIAGGIAMVVNFIRVESVDFSGFGIGISTIMAALAAKYWAEK